MRFRYTIKELQERSDYEMLQAIVVERQSDCTNRYSPLHQRLQRLYDKLNDKQPLSKHRMEN